MRFPVWAWLALSSLAISNNSAAAERPRYGGTLTVELLGAWDMLDAALAQTALSVPVAETLVRVNSRGETEPLLAVAWQHDPDFKRWRFSLRPKVAFHDGEALTAAATVPALLARLKQKYGDISIEAGGLALEFESGRPMPELLRELALPEAAVFRKSDANPLIGTGPFRVAAWEPGRRVSLAAFDDYWGGRPFLDAVQIEFGSERGHADLFEIPAGPARRIFPENLATWSSAPRALIAMTATNADPMLLPSLALAIDRAPIANVLAQHKAEAAFGLLPQWLSGYAFLFQSTPDAVRAKQLMSSLRPGAVSLSYPPNDPFLRSVAERVALNAHDAGIAIQPTSSGSANLRLLALPVECTDAAYEIKRIAERLGAGDRAMPLDPSKPETIYQLERSLLDEHHIVPLVHLRQTFGIAPRVHFLPSAPDTFALHLESAWIEEKTQP